MALGSGELAQVVWAETRELPPGRADGSGDVNGIRRLVAQLAASLDGAQFGKRDPLPSVTDTIRGDTARGILAIAEAVKDSAPPQSRLIFWEAGDKTTRPGTVASPAPAPWSTMPSEGITYQGRYSLPGGRVVDIFSRAPLDGDADGAPFVSAITGTGLPGGKPLLVARSAWAGGNPKLGLGLFLVALAIFLFTAVWAYGVGLASRLTIQEFTKSKSIQTDGDCDPRLPSGTADFAHGPRKWQVSSTDANACVTAYAAAQKTVAEEKVDQPKVTESKTDQPKVVQTKTEQPKAAEKNTDKGWIAWFAYAALNLSGSSGTTVSLVLPLAFGFIAFTVLFIAAGYGVNGRPMGTIIDERYRMSLTVTQAVLWAVVILGAWLVLGLYNIGLGGIEYSKAAQAARADESLKDAIKNFFVFPQIPKELWAVLGLAAITPIASRLISGTDLLVSSAPSQTAPAGSGGSAPAYLDRNADPSQAKLTDMVLKETEGTSGLVDATRVQHAAITGILVVSYAMLLFGIVAAIDPTRVALAYATTRSVFTDMPPLDTTFLLLLATSHAALLLGKAYDKKTTEAPPSGGSPTNR
jgi:hypothetical protein